MDERHNNKLPETREPCYRETLGNIEQQGKIGAHKLHLLKHISISPGSRAKLSFNDKWKISCLTEYGRVLKCNMSWIIVLIYIACCMEYHR